MRGHVIRCFHASSSQCALHKCGAVTVQKVVWLLLLAGVIDVTLHMVGLFLRNVQSHLIGRFRLINLDVSGNRGWHAPATHLVADSCGRVSFRIGLKADSRIVSYLDCDMAPWLTGFRSIYDDRNDRRLRRGRVCAALLRRRGIAAYRSVSAAVRARLN